MRTKQEIEKELREVEEAEEREKEVTRKQKNYENFKERSADWMIGRAHADLSFINIKYRSEEEGALLPDTVHISGNCSTYFQGKAPTTSATRTYFRNVWDTNYKRNEELFQQKLNKLVQDEVREICSQLPVLLEMMGLQSNHYWISTKNFPKDKLNEVKKDVEDAQAEMLDKYSDKDFLALIRKQHGWVEQSTGTPVPVHDNLNLSHSTMIVFRYIFKHRPTLQEAFKKCSFYDSWKDRIEAKYD